MNNYEDLRDIIDVAYRELSEEEFNELFQDSHSSDMSPEEYQEYLKSLQQIDSQPNQPSLFEDVPF